MCVSNRKIPEVIVAIFSGVNLLLAVVMIVLAIRFNQSGLSSDLGEFDDYTNTAFLSLGSAAVVTLLFAIFGLTLYCCKHRICAVIFGCLMLPAASFVFVGGFLLSSISNTDVATLRQFCSDDPNYESENDSRYITKARARVEAIDDTMGEFVSRQMCSKNCPCNGLDNQEAVKQWTEMSESDLNQFGRTKEEYADNMTPLVFSFESNNEQQYDNFQDCFNAIQKGTVNVDPDVKTEYDSIMKDPGFQSGIQFVNFFETNYQCSGVCEQALFFYQLKLEVGRPTNSCLIYLKDEKIGHNLTYMGITMLVAGFVMLLTWCAQYALWVSYEDDWSEGKKVGNDR